MLPLLGVIELSHNKNSQEIDERKFWDFKNKIDFAEAVPYHLFKSGRFDYYSDYKILEQPKLTYNTVSILNPFLLSTYCCLLKVRELTAKGLNEKYAIENIEAYLEWSENTLGVFLGLETLLAINIFGGNANDYRKMIGYESKPTEIKNRLWASVWDILQTRISCNDIQMSVIAGENIHTIFVTRDRALYKLLSKMSLFLIASTSANRVNYLYTSNFKYPFLDDKYQKSLNMKMLNLFVNRINIEKIFNEAKTIKLIKELENNMNIC